MRANYSNIGKLICVLAAALLFQPFASARDDADGDIALGMSTALSGPLKQLGLGMRRGVQAALQEINEAGGVNGRKLRLVALDDAYDPQTAEANMHRLMREHQILAVVGNVGTPTAERTTPLANHYKVPLFGALTGAQLLRKTPPDRYVINYRAGYSEEMEAVVGEILANGIAPDRIAFFTQEDGYGRAGYEAAVTALQARGYKDARDLPNVRYGRNTLNVEEAVIRLLEEQTSPQTIIMVGASAPSAKFIRLAHRVFPNTSFFNMSFSGADALARELADVPAPVYVTQVVPPPSAALPGVEAYRKAMARFAPEAPLDFASLEGYLATKVLAEGIRRAGSHLSRESLVDTLESVSGLDVGIGSPVRYSRDDHQGQHKVWWTLLRAGQIAEVQGMERQGRTVLAEK